ncbi:unnamed protein product, partial [Didymodactylos carnosus]
EDTKSFLGKQKQNIHLEVNDESESSDDESLKDGRDDDEEEDQNCYNVEARIHITEAEQRARALTFTLWNSAFESTTLENHLKLLFLNEYRRQPDIKAIQITRTLLQSKETMASSSAHNQESVSASCSSNEHGIRLVKQSLKEKPFKFKVGDNPFETKASIWNTFGFPAEADENGEFKIIKQMASCKKSLQKKKEENVTKLLAEWCALNLRPISVVQDSGFLSLAQEFVNIGNNCGPVPVDVKYLIPCRKTLSREIVNTADEKRRLVQDELKRAAMDRCLCIIPDMWTDNHKRISYLGATAQWIDDHFYLRSLELFNEKYDQPNKKAANIIKALLTGLSKYGLDDYLSGITFVSDRGSNFKCALELLARKYGVKVYFCVAHRLNNVLKKTFYQNDMKQTKVAAEPPINPNSDYDDAAKADSEEEEENTDDGSSDDEDGDDEEIMKTITMRENDLTQVKLNQLPQYATEVISNIKLAKEVVRYIKRVNLNQELEKVHTVTLKQCTVVRWLSMSALLESLVKAHHQLRIIMTNNDSIHRLNKLQMETIEKLAEMLEPFKDVMT